MKKLVFLHGSGADKNAYNDLMQMIAKHFDVELISFNAPFLRENKSNRYAWFNKFENNGRRDAILSEYNHSLEFIKQQLNALKTNPENIILIGHSQGGGMAIHIGLETELAMVLSINGDLPYNISYNSHSATPLYWFAGKKDTYIDDKRKNSYMLINNCKNLHYISLPNSTHNDFADDLLQALKEIDITLPQ